MHDHVYDERNQLKSRFKKLKKNTVLIMYSSKTNSVHECHLTKNDSLNNWSLQTYLDRGFEVVGQL